MGIFAEEMVLLAQELIIIWDRKTLKGWFVLILSKGRIANCDIIKNNIDILMISETKLGSSFPKGQFQIHGYCEP